jgi:carbamoyltransferase
MNIVGISAYFHESACCLLQDGALVAAAAEERFSRVKHDARLPVAAFRYCLEAGHLDIGDVDCVAYYELPARKLARQLWAGDPLEGPPGLPWLDALRPQREIREVLGYEGPITTFEHHLAHAASAYFYSGFPDAAILTVDGVGEWTTTAYGKARDEHIDIFERVEFPNSLGLLYSTITSYLGFQVNSGEYKVMGLAPYGAPRHVEQVRALLESGGGGQYVLDLQYFDFVRGRRMFTDRLCELFGAPARKPDAEIAQFHMDVARSLQVVLEETLLEKVRYLRARVDSPRLCLAGGVALNCVANGRILREGPFPEMFVQPAAGDAGGCLGAAALAYVQLVGARPPGGRLRHVYLGPRYSAEVVATQLAAMGVPARDLRGAEAELIEATVDRLVQGQAIGWFHGAMEFGPRALGARSILADPRDPGMRERLNRRVKRREAFRPFAPSVLLGMAPEHFELDHPADFMLETCAVRSPLDLPAITHVDGSARPQTVDPQQSPRFAALLAAFARRTGCPVLLNTSLNVRDEPIVCSPVDALACFVEADLDVLVLEDFMIDRAMINPDLRELLQYRNELERRDRNEAVPAALYTFV